MITKNEKIFEIKKRSNLFLFKKLIYLQNHSHLFFEVKIIRFFCIKRIKSFPPVNRYKNINRSYREWLFKLKNYPIRSRTLLTTLKEGSKRRLEHPFS